MPHVQVNESLYGSSSQPSKVPQNLDIAGPKTNKKQEKCSPAVLFMNSSPTKTMSIIHAGFMPQNLEDTLLHSPSN